MSTGVGTWAWSQRGGALAGTDRLRLVAQALLGQLTSLPRAWRKQLGWTDSALARMEPHELKLPDTAFAREAHGHAAALSAPWLMNHCLRTYAWAAMLAQTGRTAVDSELLYCASVLHDLGLTAAHDGHDPSCSCFAVEGARAAHAFAAQHGWTQERCDRLAEAISLHLNVRVGLGHGPEAHLLHEGAALDVIGARAGELPRQSRQAIESRYPRLEFATAMPATMQRQSQLRPRSRAAFLVGIGFTRMIRKTPCETPA